MWVAKSIEALTDTERDAWQKMEVGLPLAQGLCWARATQAVSGRVFLVFSPDEKVGGIVYTVPKAGQRNLHFQCVNGPYFNWDDPHSAPRQLATFAMAVSKLDKQFGSLSIKPRWEADQTDQRLKLLPISIFSETQAATLIIPIQPSREEQIRAFTPRLRRTLSLAWRNQIETKWEKL